MALPRNTHKKLGTLLTLAVLAWLIELLGLLFLGRSCAGHTSSTWATGAQLPASTQCSKVYRWIWWSVVFEFPLVLGLLSSLLGWASGSFDMLNRYRNGWVGYVAVATILQMWAANVMLNLTDTIPSLVMGQTERTRAWVAFAGFAALSAINILLMFVLGDDGEGVSFGTRDPLLGAAGITDPEA